MPGQGTGDGSSIVYVIVVTVWCQERHQLEQLGCKDKVLQDKLDTIPIWARTGFGETGFGESDL